MKDFTYQACLNDLPEVVLNFILRLVPPYHDLKSCMLVNKYWCCLVRGVIKQRKKEFLNAIKSRNVLWEELDVGTNAGPTINKRYSHSACVHKGSLYVFGGCTTQNTTFNDLWKLDLNTRRWIRLLTTGTYPSPKACPSMVSFNDNIWLFGGLTFPAAYPYHQGFRMSKELHSYSSITNKWTLQRPENVQPLSMAGHSVSMQRERFMVVFGGSQMSDVNNHCNSSNSVWVFDTIEKTWDIKRTNLPVPLPRFMHSQVKINEDQMLILGGCSGPNAKFSDVWLLSIPEDPYAVWFWKEITVRYSHLRADFLWRNPVVKVDSALVVLGYDSNTHQSPKLRERRLLSEPNCNRNQSLRNASAGNSEDNVNGRRGTFKRRLPQNRQQSESSSDEGESNQGVKALQPLNCPTVYRNNVNIDNLLSRGYPHQSEHRFDSSGPGPSIRRNSFHNMEKKLNLLKAYHNHIRVENMLSEIGVQTFSEMDQLNLNKNHTVSSKNHSQKRLQLFSIDISELLNTFSVSWLPKPMNQPVINRGPEELIKYSLAVGNSEIIVFGGTTPSVENDSEATQNSDGASNCTHFISSFHEII
ncbi:F-box only protein 42 [Nymphon striatum]|nr:F-box only protein 42 [Nymphon striatum]